MRSVTLPRLGALALFSLLTGQGSSTRKSEDSIQHVASLHTARAAHTATTLRSGQVLIVGGMATGGGSLDAVELFSPARNTIRELSSLAEPRAGHTATLLLDGRVLIAGGYNGEYLRSIEIFDPSTMRFRSTGFLAEPRSGHTATLLRDGRVLLIGGIGPGWTFLRSAELYDPETGRSEPVGSMSVPRDSHTATLMTDGRVMVIGGHSGRRQNMEVYSSAEVFSPGTRRFEAAGALATPRHKHDAIRLADGRVLVVCGADRTDRVHYETTEIYDAKTASFERGPSMRHRRYKIAGTSVLLPNGDVLITSGARTAELFDPATWRFREISGPLPEAYRFAAAAQLGRGEVLVTGGYSDSNKNTNGIWRFRRGLPNER